MKLIIRGGKVYTAGPRSIRKINQADVIRRIKEISLWTAHFST